MSDLHIQSFLVKDGIGVPAIIGYAAILPGMQGTPADQTLSLDRQRCITQMRVPWSATSVVRVPSPNGELLVCITLSSDTSSLPTKTF